MNAFPSTIATIGTSLDYNTYMEHAAKMLAAKDSLKKIHFGDAFSHYWHPKCQYLTPTLYREVTTIVLEIQPQIHKDYTSYNAAFHGDYESIENAIYRLADWLWENRCPKLHTIRVEWTDTTEVSWKFYNGEKDFDREYGYSNDTDIESTYEKLEPNALIERFFPELEIDWTWVTQHDIQFILPSALMSRSDVPQCCVVEKSPSDDLTVYDEAAFNAVLAKYDASRNY